MEKVLSIVDMHKTYPGGVHAVRGVSFDVMEGESVVMVPAVLPWLEYPLVGDGSASSATDAGWGLSLMMTSHSS